MDEKKVRRQRPFYERPVRFTFAIVLCVICIILSVIITSFIYIRSFGGHAEYKSALKYIEVCKVIEKNYVGEYDNQKIKDAASAAMVSGLGDKWSYYMTADEYATYKLREANEYAGVGIKIIKDSSGGFMITSVSIDTPAYTAGLKEGMIITAVDDEDVTDMTIDGISNIIQSKLNSKVKFTIKQGNSTDDYTLDCSVIKTNPVEYELKDGSIGYIRIKNFDAGAGNSTLLAINDLLSQGATSLIFDVRNNPGGMLSELITVLDYILPEGDLFVSIDRDGNETVTRSDNLCLEVNMVVLINENTYSAAEFFAEALSEYNWATTIGSPTTGKGRSQTTIELSDGSAVHISNRKYLTPNRIDLSEQNGIIPNVVVEQAADDTKDAQLLKAVTIVKAS